MENRGEKERQRKEKQKEGKNCVAMKYVVCVLETIRRERDGNSVRVVRKNTGGQTGRQRHVGREDLLKQMLLPYNLPRLR